MRALGRGRFVWAALIALVFLAAAIPMPVLGLGVKAAGFVWTRQFGTSSWDEAWALAADGSGAYVGGSTRGALPGQVNQGSLDAFIRKYDTAGTELWTRQFGTSGGDIVSAIATDASGVYVAGDTGGALPGQINQGSSDAFLRKYDTEGNELWTRQFGSPGPERWIVAAVNGSGAYISGHAGGLLPGQVSGGAFLRKYDIDGDELWTRQFGTTFGDRFAIAAEASAVYVGGAVSDALPGQVSLGEQDAFVRKYDRDGNELWTRQFGTSESDDGRALAADGLVVYIGGGTFGTFPGQPPNAGMMDAYVRKYGADGTLEWARQFGSSNSDAAEDLGLLGATVYAAGYIGGGQPFVRKYAAGGGELWRFDFDFSVIARAVAVSGSTVYVAGDNPLVLTSNDAWVVQVAESPDAPVAVQASGGDGKVDLKWQPPGFDGGLRITAYRIYRGTSSGSLAFLVELGNVLNYTDMGVTNGATYYYEVSAVNGIGEGPGSNEASARPSPPLSPSVALLAGAALIVAALIAAAALLWRRRRARDDRS